MDTKTPPSAPAPERRTAAWIGKAVRVEGTVISTEDLTIGPGAAITANLAARAITISGSVVGNVVATEKVDLHTAVRDGGRRRREGNSGSGLNVAM